MNDLYKQAIITKMSSFNVADRTAFLLLSKYLAEFQQDLKFNLLNLKNTDCLQNPDLSPDEFHLVAQVYQENIFFNDIKSCIKKTGKIKKLGAQLKEYLIHKNESDPKTAVEHLTKFLNIIVMVNLIKKIVKNVPIQSIVENDSYKNLNKKVELLNLDKYMEADMDFKTVYTYDSIDFMGLFELEEDDYNQLYYFFNSLK